MLILLDIDGVMVPAKSWSAPLALPDGFYEFSKKAVGALNDILKESKAKILLTTSHKHNLTLDDWIKIFNNRGIKTTELHRLPPNDDNLNRRDEITHWFSTTNSIVDFLILDDDKSLNNLSPVLKARLIQTKPLVGLTESHVEKAIKILNTPLVQV